MLKFPHGTKMHKKGVEIQFNWIFILIVGAIILTFFIVIVQKQRQYTEEGIAETMQSDLQTIFTSSQVSIRTASIIEISPQIVEFKCEQGTSGFRIGNQNIIGFPYSFAPDKIKSDRNTISAYAYDWSVPYRATNFLYVTSPDVRYVLVGSSDDTKLIDDLLPPRYIEKDGKQRLFMNKEITTPELLSSVKNQNNYKAKFVFINQQGLEEIDDSFEDSDVSAINININEMKIDFYKKSSGNTSIFERQIGYLGEAGILAAIFAEDSYMYECGMNNAFQKLVAVSDIYYKRTEQLKLTGKCESLYAESMTVILNIGTGAGNKNYDTIDLDSQELEGYNEDIQENSCPVIY